jgi:DNA-3-methyladenine glycosylase I
MINRCQWSQSGEEMIKYHDEEWGVPVHDDRLFFEHLVLDINQAGLSWKTILLKRENFRKAFDNFDPYKIAKYDTEKFDELMQDAGIIRNKMKIGAAIQNAKLYIELIEKYGSFDKYIWQFTGGKPIVNKWVEMTDIPAKTELSDKISKELKSMGFKFLGSTVIYAFMQAAGLINDHVVSCFRYEQCKS